MCTKSFSISQQSTSGKQSRQWHGFTLIELLVVVAIIALLISILLPSLNKAREQARKAVCASQMHQMGLAFMMYVDDNFDYMPMHSLGFEDRPLWSAVMRPYMVGGGDDLSIHGADRWDPVNFHPIFVCPSNKYRFTKLDSGEEFELNYVYNGASLVWYANAPMKYKVVRVPAEKVVIADGFLAARDLLDAYFQYSVGYYAIFGEPYMQWNENYWRQIWALHAGKEANITWADGHVAPEKPAALQNNWESFHDREQSLNYWLGWLGEPKIRPDGGTNCDGGWGAQ